MYTTRYRSHHDASRALKKQFMSKVSSQEYLEQALGTAAQKPLVLYLHVPFCNKICSFCPFYRPDELKRNDYHNDIIKSIRELSEYPFMKKPVGAVNFGGGTPTSLKPEQMDAVFRELHSRFFIQEDAEISVETSATDGSFLKSRFGYDTVLGDCRNQFLCIDAAREYSVVSKIIRYRKSTNAGYGKGVLYIYDDYGRTF